MECADLEHGFLATPEKVPVPGIVLVHDVWGLAEHTRDLARRLAAEGFATLAVDLYRRLPEPRIEDPGAWIRALSDPEMLEEIQGAIDLLAAGPAAGRRVGIVGFCMGGAYVILAAAQCRGLSAAVPFYGMLSYERGLLAPPAGEPLDRHRKPRSPLEAADAIACPMLAFFGADDTFIDLDEVRRFEARLAASGQPCEVKTYQGAGHAFLNDTRPAMYRPDAARDAWSRMVRFFRHQLAGEERGAQPRTR